MFASMSTFRSNGVEMSAARIAGESMEAWLRGFEGYAGLLVMVDEEGDRVRVTTFWKTREAAEESARGRAQVREDLASRIGVDIESVERYEITYFADLAFE